MADKGKGQPSKGGQPQKKGGQPQQQQKGAAKPAPKPAAPAEREPREPAPPARLRIRYREEIVPALMKNISAVWRI